MKKISTTVIASLLLASLFLTGCSADQAQMNYIGAEKAKSLALDHSGLAPSAVELLSVDLSSKNGFDYYKVGFTSGGKEYTCDVDALTGVIIDSTLPSEAGTSDPGTGTVTAASPSVTTPETPSTGSETADGSLTAAEAEAIALKHAGLTVEQVTIVRSHLDRDDGRNVYDVEFYTVDGSTQKEYDYEIDAATGKIRDVDYDAEYYKAPQNAQIPGGTGTTEPPAPSGGETFSPTDGLTEAEVKAIALAQVPGATNDDIRLHVDYDDGRIEYEGQIIYKGLKYEFEIDGYSGAIRDWDVDSIFDD